MLKRAVVKQTSIACAMAIMASACDAPPLNRVVVPGSDPQIACSPVEGPGASQDAQDAIARAKGAWASTYEKNPSSRDYSAASIVRFEPYVATLHGGAWRVKATVPSGYSGFIPVASVCRNDEGVSTNWVAVPSVAEQVSRFMPKDAVHVVSATEIPWLQQSFDVSRPTLEFAVSIGDLARARFDGWTLCQDLSSSWEGFYDGTVTPPRYVRQKMYILYRKGVLVSLVGRYYGANDTDLDTQLKQGSAVQHGTVIGREATGDEFDEAVESFQLSCDPTTSVR